MPWALNDKQRHYDSSVALDTNRLLTSSFHQSILDDHQQKQ